MMICMMPNMNQFLKQKKMEQRWQMKRSGMMDPMEKLEQGSSFLEAVTTPEKAPDIKVLRAKVDQIKRKLKMGGHLTASEKEFLCKYAPDLYRELEKIERECNAFAARLRACKNDSEVSQEKACTMTNSVPVLNSQDPDMTAILVRQLSSVFDRLGGKRSGAEEKEGASSAPHSPKEESRSSSKRRDLGKA